jgi:predicted aspartyl protease
MRIVILPQLELRCLAAMFSRLLLEVAAVAAAAVAAEVVEEVAPFPEQMVTVRVPSVLLMATLSQPPPPRPDEAELLRDNHGHFWLSSHFNNRFKYVGCPFLQNSNRTVFICLE